MKELMPLENINAVEVFSEGGLDDLLVKIEKEARSLVPDIETDKGRKAIASMAAKVAKSKTYLDSVGKDLVSGWKAQAKVVDNERKKMRDTLDELKADVRKPLTDYENIEKARIERLEEVINDMSEAGKNAAEAWFAIPLEVMKDRLAEIQATEIDDTYAEYKDRALEVKEAAVSRISKAIEKREKQDNEQAELEKLRQEKFVRDQKEREERIAKEAKEAAEKEAENKAKIEADRVQNEKLKAERELEAAKQRAIDAEKQAKIEAENAAKAERDKIEAEKKAEQEAASKREANTRHKKKINNQAVSCLVAKGVDKETAIIVITAIAKKEIDYVTIAY